MTRLTIAMLRTIESLSAEHVRRVSAMEVGDILGLDASEVASYLTLLRTERLVEVIPAGMVTHLSSKPLTERALRVTARGRACLAWDVAPS